MNIIASAKSEYDRIISVFVKSRKLSSFIID